MEVIIEIKKINETYIKISSNDDGVYYELYEYFSFFVPDYKFMPKYKNGVWDGKIYLFNRRNREIYKGLLYKILNFCKQRKYKVFVSDDLKDIIKCENYDLKSLGLPYTPYDYQDVAVHKILNEKINLILSPTGSGKSLIIYSAIRFLLQKGKKILLVVPTVQLVEQMYNDFIEYGWNDIDQHVHKIYSGKEKSNTDKVVVSTWQSIYNLNQSWFAEFDAVFIDEAHEAEANSVKGIMEKCINAEYRNGLTGTIKDAKVHELVLNGLFGETYTAVKTKKLMDDGILSELDVLCLVLKHDADRSKIVSKMRYTEEIRAIIENKKRNNFIINLSLDLKYNTLVLFNFVEKHGKKIYEIYLEKNSKLPIEKQKKIFFIHGDISVEEREKIRKYAESHNNVVIVASYGTFSLGINIKNLNNVFFAHPYKSKIKVLQSIGRVLRIAPNGQKATLYDIVDDYRYGKRKNNTYKHALKRMELYESEGFNYKVKVLQI